MTDYIDKFPRYFLVDFDVYVKLEARGDSIVGFNHTGNPYPVRKALAEGSEISEDEYSKAVSQSNRKKKSQPDIKV